MINKIQTTRGNTLRSSRSSLLALSAVLALAACTRDDREVAVSSECSQFDSARIAALAKKSDLDSARLLRNFYMDCDLSLQHTADALNWARRSAELGDAEDARVYEGLREANQE